MNLAHPRTVESVRGAGHLLDGRLLFTGVMAAVLTSSGAQLLFLTEPAGGGGDA